MATITDRIKQIIEMKNLTPSRLADAINVNRSRLSHILTGRNNPSLEMVQSILNCFPDINPEWLLFGQGNTFRDDISGASVSFGGLFENQPASDSKIHSPAISEVKKIKSQTVESVEKESQSIEKQYTEEKSAIPESSAISEKMIMSGIHPRKRKIKMITVFYDDNEYDIFYPEN